MHVASMASPDRRTRATASLCAPEECGPGRERRYLFPLHQHVWLRDPVGTILVRPVLARGEARFAYSLHQLRIDGQAELRVARRQDRRGQLLVDEIVGRQRKVRGEYAE